MALLRPSLTLVLDLDKRAAGEKTVLEINRCYAHIGTPVIRTHEPEDEDASVRNTARMVVSMGAYRYLDGADEGADERWEGIVVPWIGNMLRKIGNNMKVFNDRQRKIGYPEVFFDTLDIELDGGAFTVAVRPQGAGAIDEAVSALVDEARARRNDGTFGEVVRVELPTAASWAEQREAAWELWEAEHPQSPEEPGEDGEAGGAADAEGAESLRETAGTADDAAAEGATANEAAALTREEQLAADIIAKSYENTAVPPTDSDTLPRPERAVEEETEPFDFAVDYRLWAVIGPDGTTRTYDSATASFIG